MAKCALQAFGSGYYRGGFDPKMNKREAALILGVRYVGIISQTSGYWLSDSPATSRQTANPGTNCAVFSPTANKNKIREAHRKLMILNHPDRGACSVIFHLSFFYSISCAFNHSDNLTV